MPWGVIGAGLLVVAMVGSLAVTGGGTRAHARAAALQTPDAELERERDLRAQRAQGQWVEMSPELLARPDAGPPAAHARSLEAPFGRSQFVRSARAK
jgi:hypothetical protein